MGNPAIHGFLLQGEREQNILTLTIEKIFNILCQVLSPEEHEAAARNEHNFDHPDAFDFPLLIHTLQVLRPVCDDLEKHINHVYVNSLLQMIEMSIANYTQFSL